MNRRPWLVILVVAIAATSTALVLRTIEAETPVRPPTTTAPADPPSASVPSTASEPTTSSIAEVSSTVPPSSLPAGTSVCDHYGPVTVAGTVESDALVETSGIAASRTAPGVIWAHNDSGDDPTLYAIGPGGEDLGSFDLTGAIASDWEGLAVGWESEPGRSYLYIGDIGDNFGIRQGLISVYRLPEPDPTALPESVPVEQSFVLLSLDGPHNFEALFVVDGTMYLAAKDAEATGVYRSVPSLEGAAPTSLSLELIATLDLGAEVTAADVSWDGSTIAFRGYETVWMWHRAQGTTVAEALAAAPCTTASPEEEQGEALAFLEDGSVVTLSEGADPDLHVVPRVP